MLSRLRTKTLFALVTVIQTLFSLYLLTTPAPTPLSPPDLLYSPHPPHPPPEITSRISALTQELEQASIRYYVYDDNNVSLPETRTRAIQKVNWTVKLKNYGTRLADQNKSWIVNKANWGTRFGDYARGEIRWLEALERHPLRTRNASEATLFVVPIPVGAALYYGTQEELANAFRTILNSDLFQRHPERHVAAISTTENMFGPQWFGLKQKEMQLFQPATFVRDSDRRKLVLWLRQHGRSWCELNSEISNHSGTKEYRKQKRYLSGNYFSHVVSLGYGGEGSRPDNAYQPVTMESWTKKTLWFFYHTSMAILFTCNSNVFRHALFMKAAKFQHQPVSIGDVIPHVQWTREFADSKFCLIMRGDQPGSRALNRAIRAGCMPLIVSDPLPAFQPLYSKTLKYDDFALIIREDDFLKDPVRSLDEAVSSLSPAHLSQKIEGLRLMQRIMAADQPDSLFVPAFAREIVETMKETPINGEPFNRKRYNYKVRSVTKTFKELQLAESENSSERITY